MTRRWGIALATLVAPWLLLGPAAGLEASELEVVDVQGREVQLLMTLDPTVAIPVNASVSGTMEIDGVVFPAETNLNVKDTRPRTAVLVLDTSGSMAGDRLTAAKRAANSFVESVPDDVRVGLVAFSDRVDVVSPPTADAGAVRSEIAGLRAEGDTTLYDAIITGLDIAESADRARLVVLSDGADTSSRATLNRARRAADQAGIPIDIVGIQPATDQQEILRQFTGVSGGQLLTAQGAGGLAEAFATASKAFGVQVGLVGAVPDDVEASGRPVTATVSVDGRVSEKSTALPAIASLNAVAPPRTTPIAPVPVGPAGSAWASNLLPILPALVVFGAVLAIGLVIARSRTQAESAARVRQVLRYRTGAHVTSETIAREVAEETSNLQWLEDAIAKA